MRIHQIIIQGFKSYKDQTDVDPFSPKHNVIVGRNGSGKSNFFFAIRFVLGDVFSSKMSSEERQSLLHEGTGPATLSAFVEIIFDNSDQRFPTGRETVILRRTIGLKKDEYSLDRKTVTKADVTNLLQSAGFSKSNPYYIVPQGRITFLTNASDRERFEVLKEVAGTKIYENHRVESLKIMEETDGKRKKIQDLLTYIEERLSELEGEKDELRAYHDLDRNKRSIEYALYSKESEEAQKELELMENERIQITDSRKLADLDVRKTEDQLSALEEEIKSLKDIMNALSTEKQQIEDEKGEKLKDSTVIEMTIQDIDKTSDSSQKKRLLDEAKKITKLIDAKKKELEKLDPKFQKQTAEIQSSQQRLANLECSQEELLSKFGRSKQFKSQKAKDEWLNNEIATLEESIKRTNEMISAVDNDMSTLEKGMERKETELDEKKCQLDSRMKSLSDYAIEIQKLKSCRDELIEKKKKLWREDSKIDNSLKMEDEERSKSHRQVINMMDKATASGIQAVERIRENLKIEGIFGPLYELIEVKEDFEVAVDTVAGQSLFNIVVDNDATASKVLELLNREKSGRVTLMPLNRLNPKAYKYPELEGCAPLISHIKYEKRFERALSQVFGKTCICDNLEIGQRIAKEYEFSAITIEGDRVEKKGAITGGYVEKRRNRFRAIKAWKDHMNLYQKYYEERNSCESELHKIEAETTHIVSEIQNLERARRSVFEERDPLSSEVSRLTREIREGKDALSLKQDSKANLHSSISVLETKLASLQKEVGCALKVTMTEADIRNLNEMSNDIESLKQSLIEMSSANAEVGSRKTLLEREISTKLQRELDDINAQLQHLEENDFDGQRRDLYSKLSGLKDAVETMTKRDEEIEKTLDRTAAVIREKNQSLDKLKARLMEANAKIEITQKISDKTLSKRGLYLQKKEDAMKKIRDLGVLPTGTFEQFAKDSSSQLLKRLHEINDGLKKYSHVNKKAYEQYSNFTKQRDLLQQRKKDLDKSAASIQEFITVLDQRKDEAIERTYQQVSTFFKNTFSSLVPNGHGELERPEYSLKSSKNKESGEEQAEVGGLSIRVSFNSKSDEGLKMQQLSGGQKSVVALAFIFAIQQCDPAPFYLFDEIDANLDAAYRTAVAAMIHELSEKAQFITTTFRPELLAHADKFYGVTFSDKVSHVDPITKDAAMEFIEKEQAV